MTQEQTPRLTVRDLNGEDHPFVSTGLDEDYTYTANDYTGELIVERVTYGPRGTDEWARLGSTVVAAWPAEQWRSVVLHNPATAT